MFDLLNHGLSGLSLWGALIASLVLTHITIAAVTIYLHRAQSHRALDLHPLVAHFFRFWLWLTTGMVTGQWVAVHRKHHAHSDREGDPHSPKIYGLKRLLLDGAGLYRSASRSPGIVERYGHGTPNDWLERRLYAPHPEFGIALMLIIDILAFGAIGLTVWAIQMIWIPLFAAGIINGLGHHAGYRNYECADAATNLLPWGILIGGEELHNNHHAFPSSARLKSKPWEFDIGWFYIRVLAALKLARVKKLAPSPVLGPQNSNIDIDTVRAVIINRLHVMSHYFQDVLKAESLQQGITNAATAKRLLLRERERLNAEEQHQLDQLLNSNPRLKIAYDYRASLQQIWQRTTASHDKLLKALQNWCAEAETSGIESLETFAQQLRRYHLQSA